MPSPLLSPPTGPPLHNRGPSLCGRQRWAACLFLMLITLHLSRASVAVIKRSLFFLLTHYAANLSGRLVALSSAQWGLGGGGWSTGPSQLMGVWEPTELLVCSLFCEIGLEDGAALIQCSQQFESQFTMNTINILGGVVCYQSLLQKNDDSDSQF